VRREILPRDASFVENGVLHEFVVLLKKVTVVEDASTTFGAWKMDGTAPLKWVLPNPKTHLGFFGSDPLSW